ncbi:MAG: hypothetical protein A2W23_09350 [Planctomycetes bacterium RBG_16_43_13]|nr:MAG: hypothetical protein A2W23_09350 [Planctomycetes bacterium RBG_16_43_13]
MIKSILLVDTNTDTLEYLKNHLDAPNIHIRIAKNGEEALDILSNSNIDLLVTALEMPHPNGVDLLVEMDSRGLSMPVIFLSKLYREDKGVRERLHTLGPYMLLDKPIFMNRLYEAIEVALQFKINWEERRASTRYPIRLDMQLSFNTPIGVGETIKTKTIDLSMTGVCFEKPVCEVCTGYEKGGVHKDCVLYPYAIAKIYSNPLDIYIKISESETLQLKGKVVHTLIEGEQYNKNSREFIGIRFVDVSHDKREELKMLLKRYSR